MSAEIRTIKRVSKVFPKKYQAFIFIGLVFIFLIYGTMGMPAPTENDNIRDFQQLEEQAQLLKTDRDFNNNGFEQVTVFAITDGDTIKVRRADGSDAIVRYIGIDTPEIVHQGNGTNDAYGQEATQFNSALVMGKSVYLQADTADTDKYGRLLRYVYLEDGTMVNYTLIRMGLAKLMTIPPNIAFQQKFYAAQALAREEKRNLFQ